MLKINPPLKFLILYSSSTLDSFLFTIVINFSLFSITLNALRAKNLSIFPFQTNQKISRESHFRWQSNGISRSIRCKNYNRLIWGKGITRYSEKTIFSHRRNSRTIPRASPGCCCGWSNGGCRGRGTRKAAIWADCCA